MNTLTDIKNLFLEKIIEGSIAKIIFSDPINKITQYHKITLNIKSNKVNTLFQFEMLYDTQIKHENINNIDVLSLKLQEKLEIGYKQIDIISITQDFKVLINKDYNCKIIYSKNIKNDNQTQNENHNKEKNYFLKEGQQIDWLVKLGVMTKEYKIINSMQKKYRQINRFLELIDDINKYIPENAFIVDFGCGKSYLTFAIYYYFNILKNKNVTIVGLDLKEDVVYNCQKLSKEFGYNNLSFMTKDIKDFNYDGEVDMVITLHACDIATDYAIYNAIKWNSKIIMSVPCCQHEVNKQVENEILKNILDYGILKERFSAILTDGMRANILEIWDYKTQILEFIDMEHTPKNIMIRAIKRKKSNGLNEKKLEQFLVLKENYKVTPTLYELLGKLK